MTHLRAIRAGLLLACLAFPLSAAAQPTHIGYRVTIPERIIILEPLGRAGKPDTVRLMWNHGPNRLNPYLRAGHTVTRMEEAHDTLHVSYPYTLPEDDSIAAAHSPADAFPGPRATIYVDEDEPSRLHVNFWPPKQPITRTGSSGDDITPDEVREINWYYELKNRQSIAFRYHARSFGAVTIPLQYRPGYTADNGKRISESVGTGLNAAVYAGYTFGKVRYTYLEHAENEIQNVWSVTTGVFLGASTVEVDSATSLSADEPVENETNVGVLSPGVTVLFGYRGVEVGIFGGVDNAVGSAGRKWDYNKRAWIGLGVGFNVWSLLGS
jgi:hypothetical protein